VIGISESQIEDCLLHEAQCMYLSCTVDPVGVQDYFEVMVIRSGEILSHHEEINFFSAMRISKV